MAKAKPISGPVSCILAPNYSPNNAQHGHDNIKGENEVTIRRLRAFMFLVEFFHELHGECENGPSKANIWPCFMLLGSKLLSQ
jgi:hypothetical protein